MEKTLEQKQHSKKRYIAQRDKAVKMLHSNNLYDYIEGLKYAYSFCMRYKNNLKKLIYFDYFDGQTPLHKCLKAGILKQCGDTYWFDKAKAESLQQYILEHSN